MITKSGPADFDRIAVLGSQIVAVERGTGGRNINIVPFDELTAQGHIANRRMD